MRNPCMGRRQRRLGFSLMELLLVSAIVAVLVSMLAPVLAQARRTAKERVCLDNLRQLADASLVYAAYDPNGLVIPSHEPWSQHVPDFPRFVGAYEFGGKSGIGYPEYLRSSHPAMSRYGSIARFGPTNRPLNAILYPGGIKLKNDSSDAFTRAMRDTMLDLDEFHCPADGGPPPGGHCFHWVESSHSSYDHFGTSYAANIFMVGDRDGTGDMRSNSPYLRPVSRVPQPARTLLYEENIGRWAWAAREDPCNWVDGVDVGPTHVLPGWHGMDWTYNRAFVDGHVARQTIIEPGTEDASGYSNHYRVEVVWDSGTEEPHPEQVANRCIIVRGDGWAKDTLPAPPIGTGLGNPVGPYILRASYEACVHQ